MELTNGLVKGLVLGEPLTHPAGELQQIVERALIGELPAERIDHQKDGDIRYWAVDVSTIPGLHRLVEFGQREFRNATGEDPLFAFVMVNTIDAERSPNGSGGGWHRDSSRRQYKAFMYLTEVTRPTQGAFCFMPGSNSRWFWLASMAHRVITGANRYSDRAIHALTTFGFRAVPVLLPAGVPFFVNTSLIHRGLPITEGVRVMATLYLFEDIGKMAADFKELRAAQMQQAAAVPLARPAHS